MMSGIHDNISKVKRSGDARTVASNFAWLTVLQISGYVFPLITMPYLARTIGVEGFARIGFAAAIMIWMQTVADWGFNLSATRDVAQNRDNPDMVSRIFSNVLWSRILLMLLSLAALVVLVLAIPKFRENAAVIMVSFLMIPGHIMFPDWFFQAVEKMKYITVLNVIMKLLFTVAVFVFIKTPEDYILQPLLNSVSFAVCGLAAFYLIAVRWRIRIKKPVFSEIISTIKGSADIFINNLMPNLYNSFSTMLLGFWGTGGSVGILDGGNKFVQIGNQLLSTLSRAFYPYLARKLDKHDIYVVINVAVASLMCICLFFAAPLLVKYMLSPEFAASADVIRIRSISLVFLAVTNAYGSNYLIVRHKERLLRRLTTVCSLIGFCIAWPLVYFYGYAGAAWTVTISLGLLAFASWFFARKVKNAEK